METSAPITAGAEPPAPLPQAIGAYDVLFELAHGGMGAVYLARAVGGPVGMGGFERLVAVKRLHLHLSGRADSVQRFLEEAAVAARIHHANVVGIHQVGSDEAGHFLVQDYVEGDTLQGLVDYATLRRRRLPPPVVLRIALDALAGLHAVHEATDAEGRPLGILHRDVSAQNLLVGRDGVTRLADFGIAKHAQSSVVTDVQYLQGRVLYMPPEYLSRRPVDRRFDVYGMGMTLFVALSGEVPWPDASEAQIVHVATTDGVPPLSSTGLAIAPAIEAVVARASARDPDDRYPTALAMLEAIEDIGRHTGWVASHGEVAALVEELAGRELAARRAAVVRVRGTTPTGTLRNRVGTRDATPGGISEPARRRGSSATVPLAFGAAALALGLAAGGFAIVRQRDRPASAAPPVEGAATAASIPVPSAPATATSAPATTAGPPEPAATPTATASAIAPAPSTDAAPKGASGGQGRRGPAPRAPTATAAPPGEPGLINPNNPYRH